MPKQYLLSYLVYYLGVCMYIFATMTFTATSRQVTGWHPLARPFERLEKEMCDGWSQHVFFFQGQGDEGKLSQRIDLGAAIV